jgi:hypothetical protein
MRITKELAKKFLSNVPEHHNFWVNNGPVLRNLNELAKALKDMDADTFVYHANKERNDFSSWINEIVGDEKLAKEIFKSRNKKFMLKKLKDRITLLKKLSKR